MGTAYASPELFKTAGSALKNLKTDIEAHSRSGEENFFNSEKYGVGFFNYLKAYSKGFFENPEPFFIPAALRPEEFKALFELYTGVAPGKGEKEKARGQG